jgi:pimeloyl-ACP methyl ester carboxylesterase
MFHRKNLAGMFLVSLVAGCSSEGGVGEAGINAQPCARSSWIAGTVDLYRGHLIYYDYIYDDHGAASTLSPLGPPPYAGSNLESAGLFLPAGAARYPEGALNTADLVKFDLSLQGGDIVVEFELNTLYLPNQTIAAIAIDTDNNPNTGNETLLGLRLPGADVAYAFSDGDPATNMIRGRFPIPAGQRWKIWAATAQSDGTIMNVAFRGTDETASLLGSRDDVPLGQGMMFDDKQAAALMAGNISPFFVAVDVADLKSQATRLMSSSPVGFHQRVYTSKYTLPPGEGIDVNGVPGRLGPGQGFCDQAFHFLGKYQPYAIYIPSQAGPHGLQMRLHGCAGAPTVEVNQVNYQRRFGDDLNSIIASPLGRGPNGWYSDMSERDVLDVMDDVLANYLIDEDRVFVGGTSMGGYGAMRMAALYPDRFAAGTNWVGFPGNFFNLPVVEGQLGELLDGLNAEGGGAFPVHSRLGAMGDLMDYTGNLLHVPFVHLYSTGDELVHVTSSLAFGYRLTQTPGLEFDFYEHTPADHLSYPIFDDWQKESDFIKSRQRVRNPAHIVYRTDAYLAYPEYDIRHDKAYWVSAIRARTIGSEAGEAYSDVDMHSLGCGLPEKQFTQGQDAGFGPVAWVRLFSRPTGETAIPPQNHLVAKLNNVASLTVDTRGACLAPGTAYEIETDGPTTLTFRDGRRLVLDAGHHQGILN